jgi:tRNA (cmo5U34)-methyltransferase
MARDNIFAEAGKRPMDFEFNEDVAAVFDDMLARSIPFYLEQQRMVQDLVAQFWIPGTTVYDLGCSTATTLLGLYGRLPASAAFVGYDNSDPMLAKASARLRDAGVGHRVDLRRADLNAPLGGLPLERAGVVTMCWTLQFVRPLRRDDLVRWVYEHLVDDGALVVTDKVIAADSDVNRFFTDSYYAFKQSQGYSNTEIARKREALENVLIPYRLDENRELFERNGFEIVETFFQWFNFAGFLCVKKPALGPARP